MPTRSTAADPRRLECGQTGAMRRFEELAWSSTPRAVISRWASLWVLKGLNTDAHTELMARSVEGIEIKDLKSLADQGKKQLGSGVVRGQPGGCGQGGGLRCRPHGRHAVRSRPRP